MKRLLLPGLAALLLGVVAGCSKPDATVDAAPPPAADAQPAAPAPVKDRPAGRQLSRPVQTR